MTSTSYSICVTSHQLLSESAEWHQPLTVSVSLLTSCCTEGDEWNYERNWLYQVHEEN